MTSEERRWAEAEFACAVERYYAALAEHAVLRADEEEPSLGGMLLYAGELDGAARALTVAGNVAGAATLAVAENASEAKQAMVDGVVDFVVNTLDEALRILKNEVRKRQPVAVCVAAKRELVEAEMHERGVAPDLIAAAVASGAGSGFSGQAEAIAPAGCSEAQAMLTWRVEAAPVRWLPVLDGLAATSVGEGARIERRWLRLAPRFLGRMARGVRVLRCEPEAAKEFVSRAETAVLRGEIGAPVEMELERRGVRERYRLTPP